MWVFSTYLHLVGNGTSVTRLGYFLKVFETNSSSKSCLNIERRFGLFWKPYRSKLKWLTTFCASLGDIWATFYSTIWSHWSCPFRGGKKQVHSRLLTFVYNLKVPQRGLSIAKLIYRSRYVFAHVDKKYSLQKHLGILQELATGDLSGTNC